MAKNVKEFQQGLDGTHYYEYDDNSTNDGSADVLVGSERKLLQIIASVEAGI